MINGLTNIEEFLPIRKNLKLQNKKVVFTNGCFDIVHSGHVDYLNKAKDLGDILVIGLNSDRSVREIKGEKRPIVNQEERAFVLKNLKCVDYVILFDEPTPKEIIDQIIPDILIKGGDWAIENIVGREVVEANGGEVKTIQFVTFQSTTNIIKKVLETYNEQ
ncbi:MAG: D-glycero-beta-D-manno-heptose 1-phosphate adenylyltransferase [Ignavibacteriales bacterium]|nr:D-glycero-beta-D-manno-heptose 1-phosphate adenylyltransferase [Ignavibacteriales bacterium]MBK7980154.1 D-glycero-beta-D-manno-heptose 1-phosphate adenylyltransferase [Ignavibacteriota bacterium]